MANGFLFYEGNTTESASTPRITVRKGGVLVLTQAAVEMLGDNVTHVQLAFNPNDRAIGLRGATGDCKGCYRLRTQRNTVSRMVDGKRLFALHRLTAEKARSYDVEQFGAGIIGFRLGDAPAEDDSKTADTGAAESAKKPAAKTRKPATRKAAK